MAAESVDLGHAQLPGEQLHDYLRSLQAQAPVAPAVFRGVECQIILSHSGLQTALMDNARFPGHLAYQMSIERSIGRSFISMPDPSPHRSYRRLVTPAFRSKMIDAYSETQLGQTVEALLASLDDRHQLDLAAELCEVLPYRVITQLLGIPSEHEEQFHRWALALLVPEDHDGAAAAQAQFFAMMTELIQERRSRPGADVISDLTLAELDGRTLSDAEIISHVGLLFPAGGETTHGALGNMLYAVLSNGLWPALSAGEIHAEAVIEELFRWETSVAILPRASGSEAFELEGVPIKPNSLLLFGIAAANRDPAVFENAAVFDPFRTQRDVLSFGKGVKTCPGSHLARRSLLVSLEAMLERWPNMKLVDPESARPVGTSLRSPKQLLVNLS